MSFPRSKRFFEMEKENFPGPADYSVSWGSFGKCKPYSEGCGRPLKENLDRLSGNSVKYSSQNNGNSPSRISKGKLNNSPTPATVPQRAEYDKDGIIRKIKTPVCTLIRNETFPKHFRIRKELQDEYLRKISVSRAELKKKMNPNDSENNQHLNACMLEHDEIKKLF